MTGLKLSCAVLVLVALCCCAAAAPRPAQQGQGNKVLEGTARVVDGDTLWIGE